jgi:DNA replication protein DnaC
VYTQAKVLNHLHAARATNTYERRFQTLVKVPLLIIDDFGLKPLQSPQDEYLHDLIDNAMSSVPLSEMDPNH